jgi:hypothetical protein
METADSAPMTAARVRQETREMLGDEAGDLAYITDDLVTADMARKDADEPALREGEWPVCYGNSPRTGRARFDGIIQPAIFFDYGEDYTDPDDACSSQRTGTLLWKAWDRRLLGTCRHDLRPRYSFTRKPYYP